MDILFGFSGVNKLNCCNLEFICVFGEGKAGKST